MSKHEWIGLMGQVMWCRKCAALQVPMVAVIPLLENEDRKRSDRLRVKCPPRPACILRIVDGRPEVASADSGCPGKP